jgi:hypothetical protein
MHDMRYKEGKNIIQALLRNRRSKQKMLSENTKNFYRKVEIAMLLFVSDEVVVAHLPKRVAVIPQRAKDFT